MTIFMILAPIFFFKLIICLKQVESVTCDLAEYIPILLPTNLLHIVILCSPLHLASPLGPTYIRKENVIRVNISCQEKTRPQGYKTFFMLSSAETKIHPAHKC